MRAVNRKLHGEHFSTGVVWEVELFQMYTVFFSFVLCFT